MFGYLHDLGAGPVVVVETQLGAIRDVLISVHVLGDDRFDFFNFDGGQEIDHPLDLWLVVAAAAATRRTRIIRRRRRLIVHRFASNRRIRRRRGQLFAQLLLRPGFHQSFALFFRHHPTLLHADAEAALHPAELAALAVRQGDGALAAVTALEVKVIVVLDGAPEKGLARIARQSAKVVTLGDVATDAAVLDHSASSAGSGRLKRRVAL